MIRFLIILLLLVSSGFCIQSDHQNLIEKSLISLDFKNPKISKAKYGLLEDPNFTKVTFEFNFAEPHSSICGVNINNRKGEATISTDKQTRIDITPSATGSRPTTPVIFPCGGSYEKSVSVTLGPALTNTRIYYKTNHNPNIVFYERPIEIKQNTTLTSFRLSLEQNLDNHLSQEVFGVYSFPDELLIRIISMRIDQVDTQTITLSTHLNIEANDTMKIQYRWYFDSVSQSTAYKDMIGPIQLKGPLDSPVGSFYDMFLQARIIYRNGEEISRTQLYKVRFSKDLKTLKLLNIYNEILTFGTLLR